MLPILRTYFKFQDVFLKYALSPVSFNDMAHEKAWIIRVTINKCKDLMKSFFRKRTIPINDAVASHSSQNDEYIDVLKAILTLPIKYREVIYLCYYEGYSAVEIGEMLNKNTNTVYTRLARARKMLKEQLGGYDIV